MAIKKTVYPIVALLLITLAAGTSIVIPEELQRSPEYNQADVDFLRMMVAHHEGAVEMSEMVSDKTDRPELIQLSADIIETQEEEIEQMEDLLEDAGVERGEEHDLMHQRHIDYLEDLEGTEFDLAFLSFMGAHHAEAIIASERVIEEGESRETEDLAEKIVEGQKREIERMYEWYPEWS